MSSDSLDNMPEMNLPGRKKKRRKKSGIAGIVRYVKRRCPECGGDRVPVYDSNHLPIRYHKCSDCGHTFKSIELNYLSKGQ